MDWLVLISLQLLVGYFVLFLLQLCKVVVNSVWLARLNVRRAHTLMRYYRKKKRRTKEEKMEGERKELVVCSLAIAATSSSSHFFF